MGSGCLCAHRGAWHREGGERKGARSMVSSWELWLWSLTTTGLSHSLSHCPLSSQCHFFLIIHISVRLIDSLHVGPISFPLPSSLHLSCSLLICFLVLHSSMHLSLNPPLSFCVSDTCTIAPSGWWLAMPTPLCLRGFIYTQTPWLLETPGWDRWLVSTSSSWPTMSWTIKDMWVKEFHFPPPPSLPFRFRVD